MVAGESLSFVISIRSGKVSLQVIIAGSGSRPSKLIMGGITLFLGVVDPIRNKLGRSGTSIGGAKWC